MDFTLTDALPVIAALLAVGVHWGAAIPGSGDCSTRLTNYGRPRRCTYPTLQWLGKPWPAWMKERRPWLPGWSGWKTGSTDE